MIALNICVCPLVEELKKRALERYVSMKGSDPELLVSGSDDFTLFLWSAGEGKKPVARMTGKGMLTAAIRAGKFPDVIILVLGLNS